MAKLCDLSVSRDQLWQLLDDFAPMPDEDASKSARTRAETERGQIEKLWTSDDRVKPWTGTGFGWLQAINTWQHHMRPDPGRGLSAASAAGAHAAVCGARPADSISSLRGRVAIALVSVRRRLDARWSPAAARPARHLRTWRPDSTPETGS
ncbi:DUF932 domain-containing protein [Nocardia sp. NPDC058518]|uniref:DUF932 domain-containing protein n=1 Tax=Nocardia sp. NPDC058518 TaxID=3346534 RepID=UPI0036524FFA